MTLTIPAVSRNEFAGINVSSRKLGKGDVILKNRNGDVELYLPENASFLIDAVCQRMAKWNRITQDWGPQGTMRSSAVKSKVKTGGPKITVETQYGSIRIHSTQAGEASRPNGQENADGDEGSMRTPQQFTGTGKSLSFFAPGAKDT